MKLHFICACVLAVGISTQASPSWFFTSLDNDDNLSMGKKSYVSFLFSLYVNVEFMFFIYSFIYSLSYVIYLFVCLFMYLLNK